MSASQWKIVRDVIIVAVGSIMLLHEAIFSTAPNPIIVGAALALLGVPPILRLDEKAGGGGDG